MDPLLAADAVLALHAAIVAYVVGGQLAIVAGGLAGRAFVRRITFRMTHLALVGVIVAQAWLGALCPLTILEQSLRAAAGDEHYTGSFVAHWLGRWLYVDAPWWAFVAAYTAFGALVAWSWWRWPPRRGAAR